MIMSAVYHSLQRGFNSIYSMLDQKASSFHLPSLKVAIRQEDGKRALCVAGSKNEILAKGIALSEQSKTEWSTTTLTNGLSVNTQSLRAFLELKPLSPLPSNPSEIDVLIQNRVAQLTTIGDKAHTVTKKVAFLAAPLIALCTAYAAFSSNCTSSESAEGVCEETHLPTANLTLQSSLYSIIQNHPITTLVMAGSTMALTTLGTLATRKTTDLETIDDEIVFEQNEPNERQELANTIKEALNLKDVYKTHNHKFTGKKIEGTSDHIKGLINFYNQLVERVGSDVAKRAETDKVFASQCYKLLKGVHDLYEEEQPINSEENFWVTTMLENRKSTKDNIGDFCETDTLLRGIKEFLFYLRDNKSLRNKPFPTINKNDTNDEVKGKLKDWFSACKKDLLPSSVVFETVTNLENHFSIFYT